MSENYRQSWMLAAEQLGVELYGPLSVRLPSGEAVGARIHVPKFGATNGMLIFDDALSSRDFNSLLELGYGFPVFEDGAITKEGLAELLQDWGWCGPETEAPGWL